MMGLERVIAECHAKIFSSCEGAECSLVLLALSAESGFPRTVQSCFEYSLATPHQHPSRSSAKNESANHVVKLKSEMQDRFGAAAAFCASTAAELPNCFAE